MPVPFLRIKQIAYQYYSLLFSELISVSNNVDSIFATIFFTNFIFKLYIIINYNNFTTEKRLQRGSSVPKKYLFITEFKFRLRYPSSKFSVH